MADDKGATTDSGQRKCPHCGSPLHEYAMKCAFCGQYVGRIRSEPRVLTAEEISGAQRTPGAPGPPEPPEPPKPQTGRGGQTFTDMLRAMEEFRQEEGIVKEERQRSPWIRRVAILVIAVGLGAAAAYGGVLLYPQLSAWSGQIAESIKNRPKRLEGEDLQVVSCDGGQTYIEESEEWGWSKGKQRAWGNGWPGSSLVLEFDAEEGGEYAVAGVFTKANNYGMVQISLDGEPCRDVLDLYSAEVTLTKEISLGAHRLAKKGNRLQIAIVGMNPKAAPNHMFGLDCLVLRPVEGVAQGDSSVPK